MGRQKAIGTRAETEVVRYFQAHGWNAERIALHGKDDCGDVKISTEFYAPAILEVKAGKQTWNYNRAQLIKWLAETKREIANSGMAGYLVIRRYQRSIDDAEVWWQEWDENGIDNDGIFYMQYLSEFVNH